MLTAYFGLILLAAALVGINGYLGGKMVFLHGLGISRQEHSAITGQGADELTGGPNATRGQDAHEKGNDERNQ